VDHDITRRGELVSLRPVTRDDAQFILDLRTDEILGRHLHKTSPELDAQIAWMERYFERQGDWYFIIEETSSGVPVGTVAIYDADARTAAEWGRWIVRPGAMAAPESALLLYCVAFDDLRFDSVYCRTREANSHVVSFHDAVGLERVGTELDDEGEVLVRQRLTKARWDDVRASLERRARAAAEFARR
jgi:RimJ/RimL family protein N-acetyltransferase